MTPSEGLETTAAAPGVTHVAANPLWMMRELSKGLTLYRALFHRELAGLRLHGRVLDLGGKSADASYYSYIQRDPGCEIVSTDLDPKPGVLALDVQQPFPVEDESFDFVLAFNLFEHVYDFRTAPSEIRRVLKPGGVFVLCVPFLHEYHADPHDYYRFTAPALQRIWEQPGVKCTQMRALGEGLLSYALTRSVGLVVPRFLYPLLVPLAYLLSFPIDRLVALRPRLDGLTMPQRFPLGYYAVFEKSR